MKAVKVIIYIVTIIGAAIFMYLKWDDLKALSELNWQIFAILLLFSVIPLLVNAFYFHFAMHIYGYKLELNESIGLTVVNTMYSYLLPVKTGMAIRAYYLNVKHQFPYSSYLSFVAGSYLVGMITSFTLIDVFAYTMWKDGRLDGLSFLLICMIVPMSVLALLALEKINISTDHIKNKVLLFLKNSVTGIRTFKTNKKLLSYTIAAQFLVILTNAIRLFVTFMLLDIEVELSRIIMIQVVLYLSTFISITPGNLGIREGIIAFSANFISVSPDEALLVAIVDRAVLIISVFASGLFYTKTLLNDIRENGGS